MVKTILVGLGDELFSEASSRHAICLAKQHDARLTAVTLYDPESLGAGPVPIGAGGSAKELREHREQLTKEVMDRVAENFQQAALQANVSYDIVHEQGRPFEWMLSAARYYDLFVGGFKKLFAHGVVDDPPHELIRLVEAGVRPAIAVSEQYRDIGRILIAYSGSTESANTMKKFVQYRLWPEATMRIVTFDRDQQKAAQRLGDAAKYFQAHGFEPDTECVAQSPKDALLTYAAGWDADLIVLGNSAKRLMLRQIFGETAQHVIGNADRPLFLSQ
jgi:nucleotide-binding universal stress UspA family protein